MKYIKILLFLLVFMLVGCSSENRYDEYITSCKELKHKSDSFTEGLFFYDNKLYETTGLYGFSKIYKDIDLKTGEALDSYSFDDSIFGEGSVIFKDKLYVLTYKEGKILVFDKDSLELQDEYDYGREGWGLTTDLRYLIASDGSNMIYFMDDKGRDVRKITTAYDNLNELEYINGYIFANVWQTNLILVIDPLNGDILKKIDFEGILPSKYDKVDVLNGIAWNDNKIYITGKYYPIMFECKIKDKLFKEIN